MKKIAHFSPFILILVLIFLTSCKEKQSSAKIYPQYTAEGYVEVYYQNWTSRYDFSEQRYDGVCILILKKDKRIITIQKKNGNVTLDGKPMKNLAQDIFLEYYIDKLMNAEKYSMVKQNKNTIITLELNGDIRYLHYYFTDSNLNKIDIIYQDAKFRKTIYLTKYQKYRKE